MNFDNFERLFVPFCKNPLYGGGKARSYYLAIKYLSEYLHLQDLQKENVRLILGKENSLKNNTCSFYLQLLGWLEPRRQTSYLTKGYMKAALPYFRNFAKLHNLL